LQSSHSLAFPGQTAYGKLGHQRNKLRGAFARSTWNKGRHAESPLTKAPFRYNDHSSALYHRTLKPVAHSGHLLARLLSSRKAEAQDFSFLLPLESLRNPTSESTSKPTDTMFKRPAFLQSRRNEKREGDWSAFPIRQLFVLGEYIDIAPHHHLDLRAVFSFLFIFFSLRPTPIECCI